MIESNNNLAEENYAKTMEKKLGKVVKISLAVPQSILDDFTDHAVSSDHTTLHSALIDMLVRSAHKSRYYNPLIVKQRVPYGGSFLLTHRSGSSI